MALEKKGMTRPHAKLARGNTNEKAKFVRFIYMQPQKVKFKSVNSNKHETGLIYGLKY